MPPNTTFNKKAAMDNLHITTRFNKKEQYLVYNFDFLTDVWKNLEMELPSGNVAIYQFKNVNVPKAGDVICYLETCCTEMKKK